MAPGAYWYRDTFKEGSAINVEGTTFEPGPRAYNPDEKHIAVERVTLDGKTYEVDSIAFAGRQNQAGFGRQGMATANRGGAGRGRSGGGMQSGGPRFR